MKGTPTEFIGKRGLVRTDSQGLRAGGESDAPGE